MNFLVQSTTRNYKINHKIALCLNELYQGSKFSVIISSHGNKKKFLEEQTELKYELIHDITDIEEEFLENDYSLEEIKEFEETIPEKSLWRFIAMDRRFGQAFCKGSVNYFGGRTLFNEIFTQDDILKVACGYIRYFKRILTELKVDVVLFFPGFHRMSVPILEQTCKNMSIKHIALVSAQVKNYYLVTESTRCTFLQVDRMYNEMNSNTTNTNTAPGEKLYEELMSSFVNCEEYSYRKIGNLFSNLSKKKEKQPGYVSLLATTLAGSLSSWLKYRIMEKEKGVGRGKYGPGFLFNEIRYRLLMKYQGKKLLSQSLYDEFDPEVRYLYYPLTAQPEYATQVKANMWINQLTIIEALAKSIPSDWKIYVKEHPGTVYWRVRPLSFYKDIKQYPNVRLLPIDMENNQVVKNSQMVVSISSTAAWEAVLFQNKPVINFSNTIYNVTGLAKQCFELTKLAEIINCEHDRINKISVEERKRRLVLLLNSIIVNSISIKNPLAAFNADSPEFSSGDELEVNAENIAHVYKNYLDSFSNKNSKGICFSSK